jgi:hypothetical protein
VARARSRLSRTGIIAGVRIGIAVAALGLAVAAPACGADDPVLAARTAATSTTATSTTATSTTSTSTTMSTTTTVAPTTGTTQPPSIITVPPRPRLVTDLGPTPMVVTDGVTLLHPSRRVERVAFHESNHDGARHLQEVTGAVRPTVLETRDRGTGSQTAADVVVDPDLEVIAPVTGTVKRAGSYTLYCRWTDEYVVIVPDGADWEHWDVKVLHVVGVQVSSGDRVVAGETVIASRPHILEFESQVDELRTADPAWPHVHIEAVDPTVPDRPSPGGGC